MKATIYIDWDEEKVYTQRDIEEMIAEEVCEIVSNKDNFSDWLEEDCFFSAREIFNFTPEQKEQVFDKWREECQKRAKDRVEEPLSKLVLDI